jgi:hypothetical protein
MRLHETKKLLHRERNCHQTEKAANRMEGNLCQLHFIQGINNLAAQKTKSSPKINDPMKNWVNELKRAFSEKEVQMAKTT